METEKQRIEELVKQLNAASAAYYNGQDEIMPNYEWDALFDELTTLEEKTGYIIKDSPTQNAGYEESGSGQKEPHEYPALSLAKTKQVEELQQWAGAYPIWLSWKLDGLTLVLTYDNGNLVKILTRGNGNLGTNITFLKGAIGGFPQKISYQGHLVVRGEAAISYTDFAQINDMIEDDDEKYANPRNLASGTLNLEDPAEVKARHVRFHAFTLVHLDEPMVSWGERMHFLEELGFDVVDREATTAQKLPEAIDRWTKLVESGKMDIPVDGLVICYDDTDYAASGSVTGHHATRAGFAFKWQDEAVDTKLKYIEWSCAVSTISPVAVFEPVQIEGTTVSRASLCNISEIERLGIGKECTLSVIKANKIIPKGIAVKDAVGAVEIPKECPVCHHPTRIFVSKNSGVKTLHCTNPDCTAKNVKKFSRFVSKSGMDIDGLSVQTMLKFINEGFIKQFPDIYHLPEHFDKISSMEGFGEKSCTNMQAAIEKSRHVHPVNLIFALCIPLIGTDAGKKIVNAIGFDGFADRMRNATDFVDIDGIGQEKSGSILEWYANPKNSAMFEALIKELDIEKVDIKDMSEGSLNGKTFVITGDVHDFANRSEFKAYVESQGGKVTGSVSKKTDYLVNNDTESTSSKNKKAKELGMKNTIFRNSHGLDEETKNYSSAKDMAILSSYANTLPVYKEISKTKKWTVQSDKKSYVWNNRNKLLYSYKYATGGKTGYTPKAGRTLVTTASKDNLNLTIVTLNDANEYQTHESLYEYCFNKYKNFLIVDKDNFDIDDNFYKGNLYIKKSFSYPLTKEEESLVNIVIKLDKLDNYKNNDQVGSVIVNLKDKKIFETEVYVKKDKNKKENLLKRIIKFLKKLFK